MNLNTRVVERAKEAKALDVIHVEVRKENIDARRRRPSHQVCLVLG